MGETNKRLLLQFDTYFLQAQVPKVNVVVTTTSTTPSGLLGDNNSDSNNGDSNNGNNSDNSGNSSKETETPSTNKKEVEPLDEEWHLKPRNIKSVKNMSFKGLRFPFA